MPAKRASFSRASGSQLVAAGFEQHVSDVDDQPARGVAGVEDGAELLQQPGAERGFLHLRGGAQRKRLARLCLRLGTKGLGFTACLLGALLLSLGVLRRLLGLLTLPHGFPCRRLGALALSHRGLARRQLLCRGRTRGLFPRGRRRLCRLLCLGQAPANRLQPRLFGRLHRPRAPATGCRASIRRAPRAARPAPAAAAPWRTRRARSGPPVRSARSRRRCAPAARRAAHRGRSAASRSERPRRRYRRRAARSRSSASRRRCGRACPRGPAFSITTTSLGVVTA